MEPVGEWPPLAVVPPAADAGGRRAEAADLSAADLARVWAAVDASTSANTKAAYRSDWARFQSLGRRRRVHRVAGQRLGRRRVPDRRGRRSCGRMGGRGSARRRCRGGCPRSTRSTPPPGLTRAGPLGGGPPRPVRGPPDCGGPRRNAAARCCSPTAGDPGRAVDRRSGCGRTAMAAHRDAALLLMGFAGAHRRSELVALRVAGCDGASGGRAAHPDAVLQDRPGRRRHGAGAAVRAGPGDLPAVRADPLAPPAPRLRPRQAAGGAGRGAPPRAPATSTAAAPSTTRSSRRGPTRSTARMRIRRWGSGGCSRRSTGPATQARARCPGMRWRR